MQKWFKCFSDRTSQSREKASAKSADTRFLRGQSGSGEGSSSRQGEGAKDSGSETENATYQRIRTFAAIDNSQFMAEQSRAGNPIDAFSNLLSDVRDPKKEQFFKEFDQIHKSFTDLNDGKKSIESANQLDTIRKLLRSADDPEKVFAYAVNEVKEEVDNKIGELDREKYLIKFQAKILQYYYNEYDQSRGRR